MDSIPEQNPGPGSSSVKGKLSNRIDRQRRDDHHGKIRSYSPDRRRDSRDRRRDRHDYDDTYKDRPSKRRRSPSPPRRSRQSRSPSPQPKPSRAPLASQEDAFRYSFVASQWNEFYTRARAIRNKGRDLEEEPFDLFSHTTQNTIDEIFEKIEKEELYNFPKDDDLMLDEACEALSHALQTAGIAKAKHDTPEVTQALDNLRKAYDEAAKSNTVSMRYVDAEPPYSPLSPLKRSASLKRLLLARSWVKELITAAQSLGPQILVVGKPGTGESSDLLMPPSLHTY
jgi:hypothetical protein